MTDRRWIRRLSFALSFLPALLAADIASAFQPKAEIGAVRLPGTDAVGTPDAARQRALSGSAAWQSFRGRHGEWTAVWNERTGTPHRAFGTGIQLGGFANDPASVDGAVRTFVRANPDVFGDDVELSTTSVRAHGKLWYVRYAQTVGGLPVLFSDFEFRVSREGRLVLFGADAHRIAQEVAHRPTIAAPVAREAARRGLVFDVARDRVAEDATLYLLPYPAEDGYEYRTVYQTWVQTTDPVGDWLTLVDASSGEVLYRMNRVRHAISGTVTGTIHPTGPTDPLDAVPFANMTVQVGGGFTTTNAAGFYTASPGGTVTVTARFDGPFANVNRADGTDGVFSTSAGDPSTLHIPWGTVGTSQVQERDGFFHTNFAHDHLKALDPTMNGLDYPMPVTVNIASTCNAYWDGTGINFFAAGGGCVNTATVPDVVYHEYGHGVNDATYSFEGAFFGLQNGALHEGMADVFAALLEDDPVLGQGFSGPGTIVRNLDNTNRWPEDAVGESHGDGLIIGGAFWDLREAVGLPIAEALSVAARHGTPDDASNEVAFGEIFLEVLAADDDDADLSNGTPHSPEIVAAFNLHGIGTALYLDVQALPVADSPAGGSIPVEGVFQYLGPGVSAFDPSSPTLHWSVNKGTWNQAPMTATGTANHYAASVVADPVSVVEYYLTGSDIHGGTASSGNLETPHAFFVGAPIVDAATNMETNPGWTVGAVGDAATTGLWVRGDPRGTFTGTPPNVVFVQPPDDHTVAGTMCFVTGNADSTLGLGADDVDGGATTLLTPVFDAVTGMYHPIVEYWRVYSNNAGATPGTDFWQVDLSNDGGTNWTSIENTNQSYASWLRRLVRIEDYLAPTATMRMRFVASDLLDGSLVEAAVDDFRLLGFQSELVAADAPAELFLLSPASPNPWRASTTLRFSLPHRGRVSLALYDVTGRLVRSLLHEERDAGTYAEEWDGRDAGGVAAPAGLYWARLVTQDGERVQRLVRSP